MMETAVGSSTAPVNQGAVFYRYFQEAVTELQEQMLQLEHYSLIGGERQDATDHILAGISSLSQEVNDATGFIPPYDQRTYAQAIKALSEKLDETRARIAPKSRFTFKTSHKNNSAISLTDAAELAAEQRRKPGVMQGSENSSMATTPLNLATPASEGESKDMLGELPPFSKNYNEELLRAPPGPVRKPSFSQSTNVNITGHDGVHIILPSSASRATSSGSLTKLNKCIVDMSVPTAHGAPFAGLALKNIQHSLIIAGHVAGAVHITAVKNSIIVVAARQVRIHECHNVDVYVHCQSRPIIEDCSNVRFAPIPNCYVIASEEPVENQWDQVDDFKWLKAEHSPNWSILQEGERLAEGIWVNDIPGGPGVGLDDILKKVGVYGR